MPRRLLRTEDRSENRLESINGNSILLGTNFQGEKPVLATENSVEREAVWRRPCTQTHTQRRLKLQEYELKREQRDEEEADSNHEGQTESCLGTLWEADPQSQETPQGGREELHTQPRRLITQSCHEDWSVGQA